MAVSIADPPPTAMNPSHSPCARAYSTALFIESSVGSTCTPSKISLSISYRRSASAMRCGAPIALTPGSVTISTRRTP